MEDLAEEYSGSEEGFSDDDMEGSDTDNEAGEGDTGVSESGSEDEDDSADKAGPSSRSGKPQPGANKGKRLQPARQRRRKGGRLLELEYEEERDRPLVQR